MWEDLELAVSYKSCIYEPERTSTYVLSFGIQKRLQPSQNTKTQKVPRILKNSCDAIPPAEIRTARLTSIDVRLEYNYNYKRRKARLPQQELHDENHDILSTEFEDLDREMVHYSSRKIKTVAEANDSLLDHDVGEMGDGWGSFSFSMPKSSNSSEFGTLLQQGLTALIFEDTTRRRNNNQTGTDDLQNLSRIAPSVFKPGYREAMNQRSRLMPSIAKSLASMLKLSHNQALKDRLASAKIAHNSDVGTLAPLSNDDNTKTILKTRLWTIAQKQLYHAPAPKRLRPSGSFLDPDQAEQNQDENLLSETLTEGTACFDDDCSPIDCKMDIYLDSNEAAPESDLGLDETGESSSIMILGDNHTEHSTETADGHFNISEASPLPLSTKVTNQTSLYTHPISLPQSEYTETDQEILEFDFDSVQELPFVSSQTSLLHSPHFYDGSLMNICEDEDVMLCDE
ncbi:hypothetical protein BDW62DRAFT_198226 [Aspergillus aurantiobrunneus]